MKITKALKKGAMKAMKTGGRGQGAGGSGGGGSGGGGDGGGGEEFVPYEFGLNLRYASGEVFHMPAIGHESGSIKILSDFLSPHHPFVLDEPVIPDRRPFRVTFIFNGVALDPERSFAYYGIKNGDLLDVFWSQVKR
jgi:hypothetical protein